MLNPTEIKNIVFVYDQLMKSEVTGWAIVDDLLELIEWLDDNQLYRECEILFSHQKKLKMGSPFQDDPKCTIFVNHLLEAVTSILGLYEETNDLHPKNRYIISYYLALCQSGQICEIN